MKLAKEITDDSTNFNQPLPQGYRYVDILFSEFSRSVSRAMLTADKYETLNTNTGQDKAGQNKIKPFSKLLYESRN